VFRFVLIDLSVSNSVVVYLRFLTSAHMRLDPEAYEPFIFHPDTQDPMALVPFCENFVEACGREADHVQVTALTRAMQVNVSVVYLDGRSPVADFVDFVYGEDSEMEPLVLLYRSGLHLLSRSLLLTAD
jgi:ubiquitin thioesterase protein OTUB1